MSCTTVYDFINGGTVEIGLPQSFRLTEPGAPSTGRHGLAPLVRPDGAAMDLLKEHARLLGTRSAARRKPTRLAA